MFLFYIFPHSHIVPPKILLNHILWHNENSRIIACPFAKVSCYRIMYNIDYFDQHQVEARISNDIHMKLLDKITNACPEFSSI